MVKRYRLIRLRNSSKKDVPQHIPTINGAEAAVIIVLVLSFLAGFIVHTIWGT